MRTSTIDISLTFKLVIFLKTKMEKTYNDFSIIMPILGTEKELKFAEKTIPAIINLNPHEIPKINLELMHLKIKF